MISRFRSVSCLAMLAASLSWTPGSHAAAGDDLSGRGFTFGAFGTLAGTWQNTDGLEFRRNTAQPRGAAAGEVQLATDSVIGLQANARWNEQLEAVVQASSRLNSDNTWRPEITRGFGRYQPDESVMLRAGRIGYDIYLGADSRDIGYSYLTIRPPVEVYGVVPNDHFDGVDATFTHPLGDGLARAYVYAGRTASSIVQPNGTRAEVDGNKVWGGSLGYLYKSWDFRIGAGTYLLGEAAAVDPLIAALDSTGVPESLALASELAKKGRKTNYFQVSVSYDEGPLQAQLFAARLDAESAPGAKENLGYALVGYRLGKFTPYTVFSTVESFADIMPTGLPNIPPFAALNAAAEAAQTALQATQHTLSLGVRIDVAPKMDVKLQIDRVWMKQTNLVLDSNVPPLTRATMTVIGLGLDFVF
jgi:hypothetical protein